MSDGKSSSNTGSGRGRLLSLLRPSSDSGKASESSSGKDAIDSGFKTGDSSGNQPTLGRGKLFGARTIDSSERASSIGSSENVKSSVATIGAGRAKLLASLKPNYGLQTQPSGLPEQMHRLGLDSAGSDGASAAVSVEHTHEVEEEIEPEVVRKMGTIGRKVGALTNYIRLDFDKNKGMFEYEVRFEPPIHDRNLRFKLLHQHSDKLGNVKVFDGVILWLPMQLEESPTQLSSENPLDNSTVQVSVIFKRKKRLADCMQFYNVLFDRIASVLKFARIGRKTFDPTAPKIIPQYKLEVWPGYVTAVDEYEDGVMLCVDVTHRVLCQTTVYEKLSEAYSGSTRGDRKANAEKALIGAVVLTKYNNKSYRIDDIDYDQSPKSTFQMKDREISYLEYYKTQYGIVIRDDKQPLLIHRKEVRVQGKTEKETQTVAIIPEIAYLTGLNDEMRADMKVMREIATHTRITPNQRVNALELYCKRVWAEPKAREILQNWGLTLRQQPVSIEVRQMDTEEVQFARKAFSAGPGADFGKYSTNNELLEVIHLVNWIVIYFKRDERNATAFIDCMGRNSGPMGITVSRPDVVQLNDDRTETYIQALRSKITTSTQIVVTICPTSRDDRYAAIKKVCCSEIPVPSQVINSRTLSNEAKNRAIVQKIALQMNCKMGGSLWSIKIPFKDVMIIGIDTYHEKNNQSVSAMVASLNGTFTRWYSKATIQSKQEEFLHGLCNSLVSALEAYQKLNDKLPARVIIYRDGVGDGQLKMCKDYELPQLKAACKKIQSDYSPTFTFIVVQKRINTRIFAGQRSKLDNPNPGCILDHTVTRRHLYDFFLVAQQVRQGTVTPTHLIVIEDEENFKPDILQRLSYKLCFLYYNWPGTVRVPACCQYAHKLAYLVGQSIKKECSEKLADKLFYL